MHMQRPGNFPGLCFMADDPAAGSPPVKFLHQMTVYSLICYSTNRLISTSINQLTGTLANH
jgi:hypothetical protein